MPENTKTKILYIITKSNWGGAQRYVYDLATNLPADEFEVAVALGGDGELKTKLESFGIRTKSIPRLARDIKFIDEFAVFLKLLATIHEERPQIIHLNSSKIGALGALAARLHNLYLKLSTFNFKLPTSKIIFTAHGWAFKEERAVWQRVAIRLISWLTVFLSNITIVVSEDDKDKVRELLWVSQKIELVHNGIPKINFEATEPAREIIFGKRKLPPRETIWLGAVGELHRNKGLNYALEAYAEFLRENKKIKTILVIIGDGEEKGKLQNQIEELGLTRKVFLAGKIGNAATLLKAFDLFIMSSVKEGLPYGLLEAGSAGLPIIATCVGGIPEVVTDMKSGLLVRPKNSKEIKQALAFLLPSQEKREQFGQQIALEIATNFTLEKMVAKTSAIYKV